MREQLVDWTDSWGVKVEEADVSRLVEFAFLLSGWEEANILGTKNLRKILEMHIADSLSCLLCESVSEADALVDVGSGAGLPGLALGISRGRMSVTLVEATGKKTAFTRRAVDALAVRRVRVVNQRIEDVGRDAGYRAGFDVATARAVASLPVLAEYCLPLVKVGGVVVAMKGKPSREELEWGSRAAEALGGSLEEVVEVPTLPGTERRSRCLVVLRKHGSTPKKYPRRVGVARQSPLGG